MNDYYFKFEFSSIHDPTKAMKYFVYGETLDDLKLFISQHGFRDVPPESIKVIKRSSMGKYDGSHLLEPYKFRSNSSKELFTVMTCWRFVEDAISQLATDLSQVMLFGESIVRRDIEIFKLIGDLVNGLEQGNIIDFVLCDYCPDDEHDDDVIKSNDLLYQLQKNYLNQIGRPTEDTGSRLIYENLCDAVVYDDEGEDVLPITVECYISNFTEMMMDVFE